MYNSEIKDLLIQKREAFKLIFTEFFKIYLNLMIRFSQLKEEKNNLIYLLHFYLQYDKNEYEVLKAIKKKYGKKEDIEIVEMILNKCDEIYLDYYNYMESCYKVYDVFLDKDRNIMQMFADRLCNHDNTYVKNDYHIRIPTCYFQPFDDEYKDKLIKLVRSK